MTHVWVNTNQFVTITYEGENSLLRIKMTDGSEWFKAMIWEDANNFVSACRSVRFIELDSFIIHP